ncbi:MAG TPA: hypothetical protein VEG84_04180 [Thermoanaerobaculia bacterium]|nr:hypothetical protein [Thermoanaerobaculia bacterium]
MRLGRVMALLIVAAGLALAGCGRKARSSGHESAAAVPAAPTPDNSPIASLRTPAGYLLLKPERAATTPTPSAAPASNPKP